MCFFYGLLYVSLQQSDALQNIHYPVSLLTKFMCVCARVRACVCVDFFFQLNTLYLRKKEYIVWKTAVFTVYQLFASVVKHLACIYTAWSSISLYLLDKQSRFCCVHVSLYSFHLICPSFISFSVSLPRNQACARILPSSTLFLPEWNL